MRKIILLLMFCMLLTHCAYAKDPTDWDGYDWKGMSLELKQDIVSNLVARFKDEYKGIKDRKYFIEQLDDFFATKEAYVLETKISVAFLLILITSGTEKEVK